jgi:putative protease
MPENLMVPISEINSARRQAIAALRKNRLDAFLRREKAEQRRINLPKGSLAPAEKPLISVHAGTLEQLDAALRGGADVLIYGGDGYGRRSYGDDECRQAARLAGTAGKEIWFATPRIVLESGQEALRASLDIFRKSGGKILASSLSVFNAARGSDFQIWIDYTLNAFNALALDFWRGQGAAGVTLSQELTMAQVEDLAQRGILPLECMVDGRAELMVSEYCAIDGLPGDRREDAGGKVAARERYFLKDRLDARFPVIADQFGRMHVLNAKELCLIEQVGRLAAAPVGRLRIDVRYMAAGEVKNRVAEYRLAADGKGDFTARAGTTRGHYFRGVL